MCLCFITMNFQSLSRTTDIDQCDRKHDILSLDKPLTSESNSAVFLKIIIILQYITWIFVIKTIVNQNIFHHCSIKGAPTWLYLVIYILKALKILIKKWTVLSEALSRISYLDSELRASPRRGCVCNA